VVDDGENGFLLRGNASVAEFAEAIGRLLGARPRAPFIKAAQATARQFSREKAAEKTLAFYDETRRATRARRLLHHLSPWSALLQRVGLEWDLLSSRTQTVAAAVFGENEEKAS